MKISFNGIPKNYRKIDNTVSRSAQPQKEDFKFLKEQGVTDVINFRTMFVSAVDFDEKTLVEDLGMKYHNIPSITRKPEKENIWKFLQIVEDVKERNGKVHIHCKAGADRTGMYSLIYKQFCNIGNFASNVKEMLLMGHNRVQYPSLITWIKKFVF